MNTNITTLRTINNRENLMSKITKFITCFLVISLLLGFIGSFLVPANALTKTENASTGYDEYTLADGTVLKQADINMKGFGGTVLNLAYWLYGDMLSGVASSKFLKIDTTKDYWQNMDAVYNSITAVGVGLSFAWCVLELIDKMSMGNITGEFVLRIAIKFTLAAIFITESGPLAKGIIELGNGITEKVATASSGAGGISDTIFQSIYDTVKSGDIFTLLAQLFELVFPAIFMLIVWILLYVLLAGRVIEVGVRFAFFPIGAADVFSHGISSPGFRYMKKLFASAIAGAGMLVVLYMGMAMMGMADELVGSNILLRTFFPLIAGCSMIGAMLKVQSIMNDVAGA